MHLAWMFQPTHAPDVTWGNNATVDGPALAGILDARLVPVAPGIVRTAIALGWHLGVVPVEPGLFALLSAAPLLDTGRAQAELGWGPEHSATAAVRELMDGLADGAGAPTAPLAGAR